MVDLASALAGTLQLINNATAKGGSSLVQDAIYDAEKKAFGKMAGVDMDASLEETLIDYAKSLSTSRDQVERSRLKASEVVNSLALLARNSDRMKGLLDQQISDTINDERSVAVQLSLKRARDSLNDA